MKNIIEIFHCTPFIEVGNTREYIDRIIDDTPTAYNVEKVVEELEQDIDFDIDDAGEPCSNLLAEVRNDMIKKYIQIVRTGGCEEIKSCSTCKNNVEYPPPHTCDICTSLDQDREYEMWKAK